MDTLVLFILVGLLALEWILYREDHRRRADANRAWRAWSVTVSKADRREAYRAVRQGRAVADARLAPGALLLATSFSESRLRRPLAWINTALVLIVFSIAPVVAAAGGRWALAIGLGLLPLLVLCGTVFGVVVARRAEDALAANRRLVPETPPAPPRTPWG